MCRGIGRSRELAILDFLRSYIKADLYYESARQGLRRFEQLEAIGNSITEDGSISTGARAGAADSPQFSLEYILNPLGVYPMVWQQARNRHEPQASTPPNVLTRAAAASTRSTRSTRPMQAADMPITNSPAAGGILQHAYPRLPVYDTPTALLPTSNFMPWHDLIPQPSLRMAGSSLDAAEAGELSLFQRSRAALCQV